MRATVSVVMPFGGDVTGLAAAIGTLQALALRPGDEAILADNSGAMRSSADAVGAGVRVVPAEGERSPAHARNAGAAGAGGEWILFLDSDCVAPADLIDRYLAEPAGDRTGALVGQVRPLGDEAGRPRLAARYGAARNFLDQQAHLAHPYLPRASAANLMVRRSAFEEIGGFLEGVRAGEDTDFTWRLQQAGWTLELREGAAVEHRYRPSLRALRRQWRSYAAGRAWLSRRYPGFVPEPALWRGLRRSARVLGRRAGGGAAEAKGRGSAAGDGARDRYLFAAIDGVLALEELVGFTLSNRPARAVVVPDHVVLVAERFPDPGDPFADFASTLQGARVEAATRPRAVRFSPASGLRVVYREDDGLLVRGLALLRLALRRPAAVLRDVRRRGPGEPSTLELSPPALRLLRQKDRHLRPLGPGRPRAVARRLAELAGCEVQDGEPG